MFVTEAIAANMLCPLCLNTAAVMNRMADVGNCKGSRCMAWRWRHRYVNGDAVPMDVGYCSLTGHPVIGR